jgi:hypothetical protein
LVNKKRDQAQKTLDKACKMNKVAPFQIPHFEEVVSSLCGFYFIHLLNDIFLQEKVEKPKKKASLLDLFKNKRLAGYTIIIFFTW